MMLKKQDRVAIWKVSEECWSPQVQEKISRGITPISNWDASIEGWRNHTENEIHTARDAKEVIVCFPRMSEILTECC